MSTIYLTSPDCKDTRKRNPVGQVSGLAGLVRPGDAVSAIGIVDPSGLGDVGYQRATGTESKVMLTGLKVLAAMVSSEGREEVLPF